MGLPATIEEQQEAVCAYPELQRLIDLVDEGGWYFQTSTMDGSVVLVQGVRTYAGGFADALQLRSPDDVGSLRGDYTGAVVWRRDGTLTDVVDGLVDLPHPLDPRAPRLALALGSMPQLWTPRGSTTSPGTMSQLWTPGGTR